MRNTVSKRFDVIVIGVGGMGSAAAYYLSKRGHRVLGLERFDIPHAFGSSHGVNRIIRLAYYEHPAYVPLLQRAYILWREIQQQAKEQLLYITGSIDAGPANSLVFEGSRQSCERHQLPYEVLTSKALAQRFPGYQLPSDTLALFQPEGGFLLSERCIVSYVTLAQAQGVEIHARERVLEWEPASDGVRVHTDHGVYEAERLVITAGAWASKLLTFLGERAVPERQVLAWFQPKRLDHFLPENFPVFNIAVEEGAIMVSPFLGCLVLRSANITILTNKSILIWRCQKFCSAMKLCCGLLQSGIILRLPGQRWPSKPVCLLIALMNTLSLISIHNFPKSHLRRVFRGMALNFAA